MLKIDSVKTSNIAFGNATNLTRVSFESIRRSDRVLDVLKETFPKLQRLRHSERSKTAQNLLRQLKETLSMSFWKDGLSFDIGESRIKVLSPDEKTLRIKEQAISNRRHFKDIEINDRRAQYLKGCDETSENASKFIDEVTDKLDFPLLQIRKFFNRPEVCAILEKLTPKPVLKGENVELVNSIRTLFSEIQSKFGTFGTSYLRTKVRYGYPNIKVGNKNSGQIDFKAIGAFNEEFSVNMIKDRRGELFTIIRVFGKDKEPQNILINTRNQALKAKNLSRVYNLGEGSTYYSQEEINAYSFGSRLGALKRELEKYNEYLQEGISSNASVKSKFVTTTIGEIPREKVEDIEFLRKCFFACKAKMLKIKDKARKDKFKQRYKMDTIMSSPCLIFHEITPKNGSLHLSFPDMKKGNAVKIIEIKQNGNIGKSFFIQNNRLVKFEAKDLGLSKRQDTVDNFYTQEEIDNSGVYEFIELLKDRLGYIFESLNDKISKK
jgi:hypothetical protein